MDKTSNSSIFAQHIARNAEKWQKEKSHNKISECRLRGLQSLNQTQIQTVESMEVESVGPPGFTMEVESVGPPVVSESTMEVESVGPAEFN